MTAQINQQMKTDELPIPSANEGPLTSLTIPGPTEEQRVRPMELLRENNIIQ